MLIKQKGIIIKTVDYGESDKIITILNEYGAKIPLMVRRAKKSKSGLQANTQLFVYGLFIYSKWKGMGTLSSVDVIDQNYHLRLDNDELSQFSYELLHFVLDKIKSGVSAQLMSVIVLIKSMSKFGFSAIFNHCVVTGDDDQAKLIGYSFKFDGAISNHAKSQDPNA